MLRKHNYDEELDQNNNASQNKSSSDINLEVAGSIPHEPREHLFNKAVTPNDVVKLNRLVIPKQHAEKYVPFFAYTPEQLHVLRGASVDSRNGFQSKNHEGSNLLHVVSFDGALAVAAYDGGGSIPVNHFSNGGGYFNGSQTGGSSPKGYLCSKSNLSCTSQLQISFPTSTLVGHAHSPPPLSPPLSPSSSLRESSPNWTYRVPNSSLVAAGNKPLHHKPFNFVNMDASSLSPSPVVHPSFGLQGSRCHHSITIPPTNDSKGLSSPVLLRVTASHERRPSFFDSRPWRPP